MEVFTTAVEPISTGEDILADPLPLMALCNHQMKHRQQIKGGAHVRRTSFTFSPVKPANSLLTRISSANLHLGYNHYTAAILIFFGRARDGKRRRSCTATNQNWQ